MTTTNTTNPSIYIPRVYANIDWKRIKGVFEEIFGEGNVARVDIVKPYDPERKLPKEKTKFNRVYVHFKKWPEEVHELRQMLLDGGNVQVMYEEPWYWLCLLNRSVRTPEKPVRNKVKPYVKMSPKAPGAPNKMDAKPEETETEGKAVPTDLTEEFDKIAVKEMDDASSR